MDELGDASLRIELDLFLKQCPLSKEKTMIDTYGKEQHLLQSGTKRPVVPSRASKN